MLATWILRLYPRAWRERYESEVAAVLEQHRVTLKTSVDLLLSALDAQLDPAYRGEGQFRHMDCEAPAQFQQHHLLGVPGDDAELHHLFERPGRLLRRHDPPRHDPTKSGAQRHRRSYVGSV